MSHNSRCTAYTRQRLYHIAASAVSRHQHFHTWISVISCCCCPGYGFCILDLHVCRFDRFKTIFSLPFRHYDVIKLYAYNRTWVHRQASFSFERCNFQWALVFTVRTFCHNIIPPCLTVSWRWTSTAQTPYFYHWSWLLLNLLRLGVRYCSLNV